jgi:hypothetical protein
MKLVEQSINPERRHQCSQRSHSYAHDKHPSTRREIAIGVKQAHRSMCQGANHYSGFFFCEGVTTRHPVWGQALFCSGVSQSFPPTRARDLGLRRRRRMLWDILDRYHATAGFYHPAFLRRSAIRFRA